MVKLIITRVKSSVGMAMKLNCYVNNGPLCKIKNGETEICQVQEGLLAFKCNLTMNPMSDVVMIDTTGMDTVRLRVDPSGWKPRITIVERIGAAGQAPVPAEPQPENKPIPEVLQVHAEPAVVAVKTAEIPVVQVNTQIRKTKAVSPPGGDHSILSNSPAEDTQDSGSAAAYEESAAGNAGANPC